jgi:hypothetical protein
MYKEHTVKKSDISIFFRAEKIRVGMEWPMFQNLSLFEVLQFRFFLQHFFGTIAALIW